MSRLNVWNILGKDVSVQKMMIEIFMSIEFIRYKQSVLE